MSVTSAVDQSFLAAACFELGRRCAATGMVFAMHQVRVATPVDHRGESWSDATLLMIAKDV
jgi:acyl-CoA dehydrogenase